MFRCREKSNPQNKATPIEPRTSSQRTSTCRSQHSQRRLHACPVSSLLGAELTTAQLITPSEPYVVKPLVMEASDFPIIDVAGCVSTSLFLYVMSLDCKQNTRVLLYVLFNMPQSPAQGLANNRGSASTQRCMMVPTRVQQALAQEAREVSLTEVLNRPTSIPGTRRDFIQFPDQAIPQAC